MALTPEQIAKAGSETAHQTALMAQAALHRKQYPQLKWLHAIPNANSHRMVGEGVRKGIPDVCLPWPNQKYHGLYIELKIKTGRVRPEQKACLDYLNSVGYRAVVCWSWIEAWTELEKYCAL